MQIPPMVGYDQDQLQGHQSSHTKNILSHQAASTSRVVYNGYKGRQSIFIGIFLIISGGLCIVSNATTLGVYNDSEVGSSWCFVGQGFWGGVLMLIAGLLGIAAGKCKSKCQVIAFVVLCIVSITPAAIIAGFGIFDAAAVAEDGMYNSSEKTIFAMGVLMATFGTLGGLLCIWGSALGCRVACCSCCSSCCCSCCWCCPRVPSESSAHMNSTQLNSTQTQQVFFVATPSTAGQHLFIVPAGGCMVQFIPTAEVQTDPNAQTPMVPNSDEHLTPKPSTVCTAPDVVPNSDEYLTPEPCTVCTAPDTYSPNTYQPLVYNLPEYVTFP